MSTTVPVRGLQNDVIGMVTPRNARRLLKEGVVTVFARDPFVVGLKDVASQTHPFIKEAVMAKRKTGAQAPQNQNPEPLAAAAQAEQTKEQATMERIGAATEENPNPQHHAPITESLVRKTVISPKAKAQSEAPAVAPAEPPAPVEEEQPVDAGMDLLAEAQKKAGIGEAAYDPKGLYISNRYLDRTIVCGDILLEPGNANSALTWMPGEIKRIDTLGLSAKKLLDSRQFVQSLTSSELVQGRLDPKQLVRHGYWDGKPNPKEMVGDMKSKTGSFTLEPNANNNWYLQQFLKRVEEEEEINNLSMGEDELSTLRNRVNADKGIGTGK